MNNYYFTDGTLDFTPNYNMYVNLNKSVATERGAVEIVLNFDNFIPDEEEEDFEILLAYAPWILDDYWQLFIALLFVFPIFFYFYGCTSEISRRRKENNEKYIIIHKYGIDYTKKGMAYYKNYYNTESGF